MLAGRKPAHWAKSYGISNGTLSRLSENTVPGPEILIVMQRAENVNVNWLLSSEDRPFMIDSHLDQTSFIDHLNYHSADSDYRMDYLLSQHLDTLVVVFSQPASMQFKDKTIGYKHIEALAGAITPDTLNTLTKLKERHAHSYEFVLSDIQTRQLIKGDFGTYLLFGDKDKTGLIDSGIQKRSNNKIADLGDIYMESKIKEVNFKCKDLAHMDFSDEIYNVLSDNKITLLPSQINKIAKLLATINFEGTADIKMIKSAAQLANVKIS
jgi:hypothetical protein